MSRLSSIYLYVQNIFVHRSCNTYEKMKFIRYTVYTCTNFEDSATREEKKDLSKNIFQAYLHLHTTAVALCPPGTKSKKTFEFLKSCG